MKDYLFIFIKHAAVAVGVAMTTVGVIGAVVHFILGNWWTVAFAAMGCIGYGIVGAMNEHYGIF